MTGHTMNLVKTYPSSAEKWSCACGRQIIIRWHPIKHIVLSEGDTEIPHSINAGLQLGVETSEAVSDDLRSQVEEALVDL